MGLPVEIIGTPRLARANVLIMTSVIVDRRGRMSRVVLRLRAIPTERARLLSK